MTYGQVVPQPVQPVNLAPGELIGSPRKLTAAEDQIFFVAAESGAGLELWRTDGGGEGALLVKDIFSGRGSSSPDLLVPNGNQVFFTADDGVHGREWWTSDGTAQGTRMVADITEGPRSTKPSQAVVADNKLWFLVPSPATEGEWELWTSDGTDANTQPVAAGLRNPAHLTRFGNGVAFVQDGGDPLNSKELWKSDGSLAGTLLVRSHIVGRGSVDSLTTVGNSLFYAMRLVQQSYAQNTYLWKSDGTTVGTSQIVEITQAPATALELRDLTAAGDRLFFVASDAVKGTELWTSDGSIAGTQVVKDIVPGTATSYPYIRGARGGVVYITTAAGVWASDGTEVGTVRIDEFPDERTSHVTVGKTLSYLDSYQRDWVLLKSGASLTPMERVPAGRAVTADGSFLTDRITLGDDFYCVSSHGRADWRLWRIPAEGGVPILLKTFERAQWEFPEKVIRTRWETAVIGDKVLYPSEDHRALWSSDGTEKGTKLLMKVPGTIPMKYSSASHFMVHDGILYFPAVSKKRLKQLLWTDGTRHGSGVSKPMEFNPNGEHPFVLAGLGDRLYFAPATGNPADFLRYTGAGMKGDRAVKPGQEPAVSPEEALVFTHVRDSDSYPGELWVCDGSKEGTKPLAMDPPLYLPEVHGKLGSLTFFTASREGEGYGLWVTSGTPETTLMIHPFVTPPGSPNGAPRYLSELIAFNGQGYYLLQLGNTLGLWKSDGTEAGTALVKALPFREFDLIRHAPSLTELNGAFYFNCRAEGSGHELWKSDGTAAGTMPVADIHPGYNGSDPKDLIAGDNVLYFSADDGLHGRELWQSDGTAEGTRLVHDLTDGDGFPSYPDEFGRSSGKLFFFAELPGRGRKMHVMDLE